MFVVDNVNVKFLNATLTKKISITKLALVISSLF